jgi:DNA-binding NarL/FixJ family response regulator
MIRVLIADDSPVLMIPLRRLFADDPRFSVVGEAATYPETITLLLEIKPDILLVDLRMPGASSESAGMRTLAESCSCPIVVMTFSVDEDAKKHAQLLGAARMVDKADLYAKLLPTIIEVIAERTT